MKPYWIACILAVGWLGSGSPLHAGIEKGSKQLGAIWFVGDSITQSNADGDPDGSPRQALYQQLKAAGYEFTYTGHFTANPDGLPVTGTTPADNLFQFHSGISGSVIGGSVQSRVGISQKIPQFWNEGRLATVKPNVILILLGANDINSSIAPITAPERLSALIDLILVQPDVGKPTILVGSITPNRVPSSQATERVKAFNRAIPGVVAKFREQGRDVHFVDQFQAIEQEYDKTMNLAADGQAPKYDHLHPGRYGNEVMAKQWLKKIRELSE